MSPTPSPHTQTRAYVDHNGDLHDPDYREFPVLRPSSRTHHHGKRRRTSTGSANATRSRSHDRHSLGMHPTRPGWERDWGTEADDSDVEDLDDDAESQSHFSPFASHHASTRKNTSHSAFTFSPPYHPSTYYYFADAPQSSSPVGSLEEENALQLHESPFGEDETEEVAEETRPRSACLIRKGSKPKKSPSKEPRSEKVAVSEEPSEALSPFNPNEVDEYASTPTCTHILRHHWQAVTLRIRFGVFHAKRRLTGRRRT
ncbi:hypothetical protein C8Q79DRAFT_1000394 [Trametes meyenii]|nr:hypothetical protein C8Q79DRAFT_1000394 [Trametes meyenii]